MCMHYEKIRTRENDIVCMECGFVLETTFPSEIIVDEYHEFHLRERVLDGE